MKLKSNKVIQKIALILICLLTFNFIAPTYTSNASFGGVLLSPIKALILTMGDIVMHITELCFYGEWTDVVLDDYCSWIGEEDLWDDIGDNDITYPVIKMSPEVIFANKVELFNINFIDRIDPDQYIVKNDSSTKAVTSLRATIANWYVAIRNLSLVIMLSILIYVGIKIIISSAAQDKAKYRQMLMDWVIGICLLFMLHYIMAFTLRITQLVTGMLEQNVIGDITLIDPRDEKSTLELIANETATIKDSNNVEKTIKEGDKLTTVGNLTSYVRVYTNLDDGARSFGYIIIYLFMIYYTLAFCVVYIKRMVTVAFLTVIAPFVAMTYPIDKMNDGKAQAFNFWLKEFIYNSLIQVLHILLWSILVGAAMDLVKSNLIYAIVVMACIKPAEKLIKEMFGLNSKTAPGFAGMVAPAAATALTNQLTGKAKSQLHMPNHGKDGSSGKDSSDDTSAQKLRTKEYDFSQMDDSGVESGNAPHDGGSPSPDSPPEEKPDKGSNMNPPTTNPESQLANPQEQQHQAFNDNMDNNQRNELDNYFNSPAYGNGTNNNNHSNDKGSGKLSFKQKTGNLISYGGKKVGKGIKNLVRPKNLGKAAIYTGKKLAKTATGAGSAMLGGAAGLALGALTGKGGLAFSAMAAGSAMGFKKGSELTGTVLDKGKEKLSSATDSMANFKNEALYGGEVAYEKQKERDIKKQRKAYQNNKENIRFFHQKTGASGKELDAIMERASDFNQMGAKDNEEVLKALELEKIYKQDNKMSDAKAHQLAGISAKMISEEGYKASDFANERKRREIETRTADIVKSYGGNLSEKQQQQLTSQIMTGNEYMAGVKKRDKKRMMNF